MFAYICVYLWLQFVYVYMDVFKYLCGCMLVWLIYNGCLYMYVCVCVCVSTQYSEMVYVHMSEISLYATEEIEFYTCMCAHVSLCMYVWMFIYTQYTQMVYTNKKLSCISTQYGEQNGIHETLSTFLGSVILYIWNLSFYKQDKYT